MAEGFGDVLQVPGTSEIAEVKPGDIIAAMGHGLYQKGRTLLKDQGLLAAGTVMARVTASKKWVAYNEAGTDDGRRVAAGILRENVQTDGEDVFGNIVFSGILKNSKLVGVDANAITDLGARVDTNADTFIF